MLTVFAAEGVDVNAVDFTSNLKSVTTVTFFSYTSVTFEFSIFQSILVEINISLDVVFAEFEASGAVVICLGPGANIVDNACECSLDLTEFNAETKECGCVSGSKSIIFY